LNMKESFMSMVNDYIKNNDFCCLFRANFNFAKNEISPARSK